MNPSYYAYSRNHALLDPESASAPLVANREEECSFRKTAQKVIDVGVGLGVTGGGSGLIYAGFKTVKPLYSFHDKDAPETLAGALMMAVGMSLVMLGCCYNGFLIRRYTSNQ